MKYFITTLCLLACLNCFGQTKIESEKELKKIDSVNQIQLLKDKNPNWVIQTHIVVNDSLEKDSILSNLKIGDIATIAKGNQSYSYKLLEVDTIRKYRADHIFLDGRKLSLNKIDSIQKIIMEKYSKGVSFNKLVARYTMYPDKKNYYSDWFEEGWMIKKFESAVKNHQKGDIFPLDVYSKKWHYVVLKTHVNRETVKRTFVRIINKI